MFHFCNDSIFKVVLSNAVLLRKKFYVIFLDNSLLYVILIKDSFLLSSSKGFLYQLARLETN